MVVRRSSFFIVLVALFLAVGVLYSLSVPLFEAPDEIWHFNFIRVLATERALPVQPAEGKDMWLREAAQPPLYHLVSALLIAPLDTSDFPGWVRWNIAHPAVTNESENEAPNVFIHTDAEAWPWRGSVLTVYLVRWATLVWGAGAVAGTVLVARRVVPGRPGLALAAGALTALNPHLVFISSVVNNDATAACLSTLTLWACIRLVQSSSETARRPEMARAFEKAGMADAALLGVLLGLSLLSKLSALALLPLVALALGLAWWGERGHEPHALRTLFLRAAVVFGLAALVSGWWFARNWVLYGDPLGWSVWLIDIGVQRITLDELIRQFGNVATSYVSPYDGLLPGPIFWALGAGLAVAVAGWVRYLVQWTKKLPPLSPPRTNHGGEDSPPSPPGRGAGGEGCLPSPPGKEAGGEGRLPSPPGKEAGGEGRLPSPLGRGAGGEGSLRVDPTGLLLAGTWLVLLFASLVRYMTTTPSAEGRLLYPGIAAASLLLALGWAVVLPRRWTRPTAGAALAALLSLSLAVPVFAIVPRFARPLVANASELEGLIPVVGGEWDEVRLLGVRVEPEVAAPGERVDVRLYWEAAAAPSGDLRAVVRLRTAGGRLLAQWDEPPANERYPADLWRAGDIVRDDYSLPAVTGGPALYRVSVTLLREDETDQDAGSRTPARTAHRLKLAPAPLDIDDPTYEPVAYLLGDRAALTGYALPEGRALAEAGLALTLYWDVRAELVQDYSVFVHLVGPDGSLLGQGDGPPLNGDYPTSAWAEGESLADPRRVQLKPEVEIERLVPGSYLLVGLYRLEDGVRLPVVDAKGARVPHDAIRLELE